VDEDELFHNLESETRTVELTANLLEWMSDNVHRISALVRICAWWRTEMRQVGYTDTAIEEILPMIIQRVWPEEATTMREGHDGE
jgi:hypothetical protein